MAKITIELEDHEGQVAVGITIAEFAEDSKACQMGARVAEYIESIADRQSPGPQDAPFDIRRIQKSIRLPDGSRAKTESGIILAH